MGRARWKLVLAPLVGLALLHVVRGASHVPPDPLPPLPTAAPPPPEPKADGPIVGRLPDGAPPALSCSAARAIVAQVNGQLVEPPRVPEEGAFADAVIDWLDPHGLWSAAPGSPVAQAVRSHARGLIDALSRARRSGGACAPAVEVGRVLTRTVASLRATFDAARAHPAPRGAYFESVFEPGSVTRSAESLATLLGERAGALEATHMDGAGALVDAARERFFPTLTAEAWGDVVLAAAVRAYVPAVDPHGAWAPFEEEASLYESELEAKPPPPFWDSVTRTPVGVRVDEGPLAPLATSDLVLSIEGIALGGMPIEQVDQLVYTLADERPRVSMSVLSPHDAAPRTITVAMPAAEAVAATREGLSAERVRYGDGSALVVGIRDVREDLGEALAHEIARGRREGALTGLVLDLRGNGGGSTDGAAAALGLFLPGAPLFPMRRRDGTLEIDRATEPTAEDRWDGPVAALVDRSTASAAEMIAGALGAYRRGVVVGERTFGKGCAQEYIEDEADVGVLRLTTLVFALPDGSPLQRTGLLPSLLVPFPPSSEAETEASLKGSPAAFRGPDVRDARRVAASDKNAWPPPARAEIGPCKDADVCRGLRALGGAAARRAAKR